MPILRATAMIAAACGLVACSATPPPLPAVASVASIPAPAYVAPSGPSLLAQHGEAID